MFHIAVRGHADCAWLLDDDWPIGLWYPLINHQKMREQVQYNNGTCTTKATYNPCEYFIKERHHVWPVLDFERATFTFSILLQTKLFTISYYMYLTVYSLCPSLLLSGSFSCSLLFKCVFSFPNSVFLSLVQEFWIQLSLINCASFQKHQHEVTAGRTSTITVCVRALLGWLCSFPFRHLTLYNFHQHFPK